MYVHGMIGLDVGPVRRSKKMDFPVVLVDCVVIQMVCVVIQMVCNDTAALEIDTVSNTRMYVPERHPYVRT